MLIERKLKSVVFSYNTETKRFKLQTFHDGNAMNVIALSKAESGAFARFVFSIFQYHSHKRRKEVNK